MPLEDAEDLAREFGYRETSEPTFIIGSAPPKSDIGLLEPTQ
jgi:hypothetical protein